ncbi:MAG: adenosylcobinamide-GDP ribazoletransferase [Nitrospinae bacterium]|nr:adenosylcobinamide-GDP ribazoletransferase [Nitrospinota bacterium]
MILNSFLLSLQFLTIINVKNDSPIDEKAFGKIAILFPLVGALIGILLVVTSRLSSAILPLSVSDATVLIVLILITGGLHVDGFADTIDGFAGGKNKDDILRIMKDSRIGTFGVVGIVMLLLTKYLSIQSLQPDTKYLVLIIMPVIGRWSVLPMGLFFKYARIEGGTGKIFAESIRLKELIIGTIIVLSIIIPLFRLNGFLMLAAIFIVTLLIGRYSKRKIDGITGDVFGATIEINELIILILSLLV